jgi:hypothetical protein
VNWRVKLLASLYSPTSRRSTHIVSYTPNSGNCYLFPVTTMNMRRDKKRKLKDDAVVYGGAACINDYKPDEVNGTARQKKKKSTTDMAFMHLLR